jgi:type IV pilus assembly protein PilE
MKPSTPKHRQQGVTLLELMAVVIVIGVLGTIAIPSYRQYVMRAQRVEAKNALLQVAANQERFYLTNRSYGTVAQLIGANLLPAGGLSERGTYQITMAPHAAGYAVGYTATATPVAGGQVDMRDDTQCTTFSIDAQGVRTATGGDAASCW